MGTDLASRLRARFSKRRHSAATSVSSSHSCGETSSLKSQQRDRDQSSLNLNLNAPSQTRVGTPLQSPGGDGGSEECSPRQGRPRQSSNAEPPEQEQYGDGGGGGSGSGRRDQSRDNHLQAQRPASSPVGISSAAAESPVALAEQSRRLQATSSGSDTPGSDLHPPQTQPQHYNYSLYPPQPSPALSLPPPPRNLDSIHEGQIADRPAPPDGTATAPTPAPAPGLAPAPAPTPASAPAPAPTSAPAPAGHEPDPLSLNLAPTPASSFTPRPPGPPRRQSLLSTRQTTLIKTLLHNPTPNDTDADAPILPIEADMVTRKIWVKRPNASPTLVVVNEDDLVDDVRDLILRKYANSLGRTFDSPDLTIRICPRDQHKERPLGPEEPVGRTLDAYYPGGQTVDEALVIDIPRRGPKASPRPGGPFAATTVYYAEDGRPSEAGEGYFPPVGAVPSPHLPVTVQAQTNGAVNPPSIAILGTGHIPPIPSPGGTRPRSYRERNDRPRIGRTHTSSPTVIGNGPPNAATAHGMQSFQLRKPRSRTHSNSSAADQTGVPPTAPPVPTPPAPEPTQARVATPPPRISSPRASSNRPKKSKKTEHISLPPGMLNTSVPPISVLIVEDNPINLKLLEAFVKRLKVRWQTAMNGRDAVTKWRTGGFHLVLMDIQLPVMNGLDATREIRRLERVNSIGVFSSAPSNLPEESNGDLQDSDRLQNLALFKSPVIIVALTASSLQSDRHEALAAGCNDFLTKPVNFVWLERKVMEWGCMQALIDFDGWRKWKDFSHENDENESSKKATVLKPKTKKNRLSMSSNT